MKPRSAGEFRRYGVRVEFRHREPLQLLARLASTAYSRGQFIGSICIRQCRLTKVGFRPGVDRDEATAIPAVVVPTGIAGELEAPRARTRIDRCSAGSHRPQSHSMRCTGQIG